MHCAASLNYLLEMTQPRLRELFVSYQEDQERKRFISTAMSPALTQKALTVR